MHTSHGHYIPGSFLDKTPPIVSQCGGYKNCAFCAKETATWLADNHNIFQSDAQLAATKGLHPSAQDETVTHNEDTLFRVREALLKAGLDENGATNAISEILNHGVVFREPAFGEPAFAQETKREDGGLVAHARRELELLGEEPETIEWYLSVIRAFCDFGHSGGSSSVMIPIIHDLLQYKNLKPLTDNPKEWMDRREESGMPLWQSIRRGDAFSEDGGKTHYLLNAETAETYTSQSHLEAKDSEATTSISE